jgi:hypothetical protein
VVQAHPVLAALKTGDLHGGPVDLRGSSPWCW